MLKMGRRSKRYIEIESLIHFALSSMPQDTNLVNNAQDIMNSAFEVDDLEASPSKLFN